MPATSLQRLRLLGALPLLLASCGSMQPDGTIKDLIEGKYFYHEPVDQAKLQKQEDLERDAARQVPPIENDNPIQLKFPL